MTPGFPPISPDTGKAARTPEFSQRSVGHVELGTSATAHPPPMLAARLFGAVVRASVSTGARHVPRIGAGHIGREAVGGVSGALWVTARGKSKSGGFRGVKKENLPVKTCVVCNRPFTWRKKWERCWDEVTTCSKSCNAARRREKRGGGAASGSEDEDEDEDDGNRGRARGGAGSDASDGEATRATLDAPRARRRRRRSRRRSARSARRGRLGRRVRPRRKQTVRRVPTRLGPSHPVPDGYHRSVADAVRQMLARRQRRRSRR